MDQGKAMLTVGSNRVAARAPGYSMVYTLQMMKTVNWVKDTVDGLRQDRLRQDRRGQDKGKRIHLESDLGDRGYSRLHPARQGGIYNLSIPF